MIRKWFLRFFMPHSTLRSWALRELHENGATCTTFCQITATLTHVREKSNGALTLGVCDVEGVSRMLDGKASRTLVVPPNLVDLDALKPQLVCNKRIVAEVNPKTWIINRFVSVTWRLRELTGHVISWCQRTNGIEVYVHTPNDTTHDPLDAYIVPSTIDAYARFKGFLEHCVAHVPSDFAKTEVDMMVRKGSHFVQAVRYRQVTDDEVAGEKAQQQEDSFMKVTFAPPQVKWSKAGSTLTTLTTDVVKKVSLLSSEK